MKTKPNKVQIIDENGDKQNQNTHLEVSIFARQKSMFEVGFGLFRIIFKLPKLKQKKLALNLTEILQLKTAHVIAHVITRVILLSSALRTFKEWTMSSVRSSNSGCTRIVGRARR